MTSNNRHARGEASTGTHIAWPRTACTSPSFYMLLSLLPQAIGYAGKGSSPKKCSVDTCEPSIVCRALGSIKGDDHPPNKAFAFHARQLGQTTLAIRVHYHHLSTSFLNLALSSLKPSLGKTHILASASSVLQALNGAIQKKWT
jgi:hypothetical protein